MKEFKELRLPDDLRSIPGVSLETIKKLNKLFADAFGAGMEFGRATVPFSESVSTVLEWAIQPGIIGKLSDRMRDAVASGDDEFSICRQFLQTIAAEVGASQIQRRIAEACDKGRAKYTDATDEGLK